MKYRIASYELYAFAITACVIDHVGLYLYDSNVWLRAFRMFALVWFLPAGYNAGRKPDLWMYQSVVLLAITSTLVGMGPFPLSAVATIIAVRLFIDRLGSWAVLSKFNFWVVNAGLLITAVPSDELVEYGSIAAMIGLAGWLLRNREDAEKVVDVRFYFGFVTLAYLVFTAHTFPFNAVQWVVVVASTCLTAVLMYNFRDLLLETVRRKNPDIISRICRWVGHNTLQIYTIHLLILQSLYYF